MEIGHHFTQLVYFRGVDYFNKNRVHILEDNETLLRAHVEGKERYIVRIEMNDGEIDSMYCSCDHAKAGNNCKHMVATLMSTQKSDYTFKDFLTNKPDINTLEPEVMFEIAHMLSVLEHDDLIDFLVEMFEKYPWLAHRFTEFDFERSEEEELT